MIVDSLQTFGQMLKIRSDNLKNQTFGGSTLNLSTDGTSSNLSSPTLRGGQSVQNLSTIDTSETDSGSAQQIPGMPSFDDILFREVGFVMLQLVNGLKNIQAKGIEELPLSLTNVILCKELENKESQARLHVLHGLVFFFRNPEYILYVCVTHLYIKNLLLISPLQTQPRPVER